MSMTTTRKPKQRRAAVAGALAGVVAAGGLAIAVAARGTEPAPRPEASSALEQTMGRRDLQEDGPLLAAQRITLDQAKERSPYSLPVPPTNAETSDRAGIWIDRGLQIAFVWLNDMRFYVDRTDLTPEVAAQEWSKKVATEPELGWVLTTVRGQPAIGADRANGNPSSLTWIERGLSIQFVSPAHSLDELKQFAESVQYEG